MADPVSGLGLATSVIGGSMQKKAAQEASGDASAAQLEAARMSVAEQRRQFNALRKAVAPWIQAGGGALQAQLDLMGLGGSMQQQAAVRNLKESAEYKMFGADKRQAALKNLRQSEGFRAAGQEERKDMLGDLRGSDRFQRFGQAGRADAIQDLRGQRRFDAEFRQDQAIKDIRQGSEFQNLVETGENALLANAAATGGLRGGDAQRSLAELRPAMLNQLIQQKLGQYGGLSTAGQNSATGVGASGMAMANNISGLYGDMGAAQAGNYLAQGQATSDMWGGITQGIGNALGGIDPAQWQKWGFA